MARWAATLQHTGAVGVSGIIGLVGIVVGVCMAVMVVGLCAVTGENCGVQGTAEIKDSSDSDDSSSRSSGRSPKKWLSFNISSKKLLSWKRWRTATHDELSTYDRDFIDKESPLQSAVWQRTILMGERCEPPVFSGLILYDEYGKQVQEFPLKSPRSAFTPPSMRASS
eukprot:c23305_g3_i1 orf=832-1335(-)